MGQVAESTLIILGGLCNSGQVHEDSRGLAIRDKRAFQRGAGLLQPSFSLLCQSQDAQACGRKRLTGGCGSKDRFDEIGAARRA